MIRKRKQKPKDPEEWARDLALNELLKHAGFSFKPKGKQMLAGIWIIMSVHHTVNVVVKALKKAGWKPPKNRNKKRTTHEIHGRRFTF